MFGISLKKDLVRLSRDPAGLAAWLGIPVFVALILGLLFGGSSGGRPRGVLLMADEDESIVSGFLKGAFQQGPLAEMVKTEAVKQDQGRARMAAGDASALVVIPKGFGQAFLKREKSELVLTVNPSQQIMPGMIKQTLELMLEGAFYVQELGGKELGEMAAGASLSSADVVRISTSMNRLGNHVGSYLSPPRIELETEVVEVQRAGMQNAGKAFFPGMLFLALLFTASGFSDDVWKERMQGTLRRTMTTPGQLRAFVAGKVMAMAMVFTAISVVGLVLGWLVVGIPAASIPLAMIWLAATSTAFYVLLVVMQMLASSQRGGSLLVNLTIFPLVMLGGSFFPFEAMPGWMAAAGRMTPNGWAVEVLGRILFQTANWTLLLTGIAGYLAAGGIAFLLTVRRLRSCGEGT